MAFLIHYDVKIMYNESSNSWVDLSFQTLSQVVWFLYYFINSFCFLYILISIVFDSRTQERDYCKRICYMYLLYVSTVGRIHCSPLFFCNNDMTSIILFSTLRDACMIRIHTMLRQEQLNEAIILLRSAR